MSDTNVVLDANTIDELKDLLGEAFPDLIDTYLTDSEGRIARLESAIEAMQFVTIREEAHGLKGSSRNLGVLPLGNQCERLEHAAKNEEAVYLKQYLSAIKQLFAAARTALQEEVK